MKALYQKIRSLDGKPYGNYKNLAARVWDFGDFELEFIHVQGDPYAPASRVLVRVGLSVLGYSSEWGVEFDRRLALSDFLYRKLGRLVQERYPGKDASVIFDTAGPEMLVRNSLWIDNGELRACLQVRLPGEGRKIQAEQATEILTMVLPDLVSAALYCDKRDERDLREHYRVLVERRVILGMLKERGLCAFVPDGAVLPRASGLSESPLEGAVPFCSPVELAVTLDVCGRKIRGMGIPCGITVITGGAYHGKSTLLQALSRSVHPHIPGDGREGIVVDESALRVGVEDGRSVRGTDLSVFVRDLPGGVSTKNFSTLSASGSTSEAANLLEAIEAGSRTFFIDEDSSAVNFLIRDVRVRKLLGDEREPLIPLTDRIRELASMGMNFVLVAGACGDYLDIADNIIVMADYKAECAKMSSWSREAIGSTADVIVRSGSGDCPELVEGRQSQTSISLPSPRAFMAYVEPLQKSVRPFSAVERQVKVKLVGDSLLQIGFLVSDTSRLNALVDKQQRLGAGFMLLNMLQSAAGGAQVSEKSVIAMAQNLCNVVCNVGFRNLPQGMSREMSLPRAVDIACVAFRLSELNSR